MFDVRITRQIEREHAVGVHEVKLVSREVSAQVDVAGSQFGVRYRGPAGVESGTQAIRIFDHVLALRLAVLALLMLGITRRWMR